MTADGRRPRIKAWLQLEIPCSGPGNPNDWTLKVADNDKAPKVKNLGGQGELTEVWSEIGQAQRDWPGGYSPSDWVWPAGRGGHGAVQLRRGTQREGQDHVEDRREGRLHHRQHPRPGLADDHQVVRPEDLGCDKAFDIGTSANEAQERCR